MRKIRGSLQEHFAIKRIPKDISEIEKFETVDQERG